METAVHQVSVPLNILMLEDEPEILEDLCYRMEEAMKPVSSKPPVSDVGEEGPPTVHIETRLLSTDNVDDTRQTINKGQCDLLIADYKVKEKRNSAKATASILPFLKELKNRNAFIPVIGHTAYIDQLKNADREDLAVETIYKVHSDSLERVVDKGAKIGQVLQSYKRDLLEAFEELKHATRLPSPIDQQNALKKARLMFADLHAPSIAPGDYDKALVTFIPLIMRLSSIPSARFDLGRLTPEFIQIITPIIRQLQKPFFSYSRHALPVFKQLEAAGYSVIMRIPDDVD